MSIDSDGISDSHGVAMGQEASASAANANVTIHHGSEPGVRDMIRMLWVQSLNDQIDRRERQHETDAHRAAMLTRIERIERFTRAMLHSIWMLRAVALGLALADLILFAEFTHRLGWW